MVTAAYAAPESRSGTDADKPNIIFVLTDDMSWGELGCSGNEIIKTPNIDRLYDQSLRFRNFNVAAYCAPTRAQLMSGRHEFYAGVTDTRYERDNLRDDLKILPQYFKDAGYRTAMIGKWHLASLETGTTGKPLAPYKRGFDMALYVRNQVGRFDPALNRNGKDENFKGYCGDILFEQAMKWIEEGNQEQPYFMYLATSIPHSPLKAPKEYLALYEDAALGKGQKSYYAMVSNIDENMGRLMKWLENRPDKDNTILIFTTDNGHTVRWGGHDKDGFLMEDGLYNAGLRGGKNQQWRGGSCVPFIFHWPGVADKARDNNTLASGLDIIPTFCDIIGVKSDDSGLQGYSLFNDILGKPSSIPEDRMLFNHCGRWTYPTEIESFKYHAAVVTKRFRLVWETKQKSQKDAKRTLALYDYRSDPGEKQNVIEQHPEVAKRLAAAFEPWWEEAKQGMVNDLHQLETGNLVGPESQKAASDATPKTEKGKKMTLEEKKAQKRAKFMAAKKAKKEAAEKE
ncbi:arylsulfatase [Pontiella desulfatans]|nr:arylsulfatase [Pontiella desulfatans]